METLDHLPPFWVASTFKHPSFQHKVLALSETWLFSFLPPS